MSVMQKTSRGDANARSLDIQDACRFINSQADRLGRALDHRDIPEIVGSVLGGHDASHSAWLDLIADADRTDDALAERLSQLYSYHGCIVGALERAEDPRLTEDVRRSVRRLLSRELAQRTEQALDALRALDPRGARKG